MNKCERVCDNEYLKEHIRVVKEQGSKTPDKNIEVNQGLFYT